MYKQVEFCDLCNADGAFRIATAEYVTAQGERVVVCPPCEKIVNRANLVTQPLDLDETFLEDIRDGFELAKDIDP